MEKLKADLNMGNNLRRLRKANGLTQDQLVARLGILGLSTTRGLYSRYEPGELNTPTRPRVALHPIYHCTPASFFEGLTLG